MSRPLYRSLHVVTLVIFGEEKKSWSSSLCNLLYSPVTSSLLDPNIFLSTQMCNTLIQRFPLNVRDQVWHPYKTADKIIIIIGIVFKIKIKYQEVQIFW
jgi:hypothetical protein